MKPRLNVGWDLPNFRPKVKGSGLSKKQARRYVKELTKAGVELDGSKITWAASYMGKA